MQVLKPQALGLSTRPIEFRKRFGLSISGCLHLPFDQGPQGSLWAEQSMWSFLAKEMAVPLIDEGVVKLTPEFLVHGKAYAPRNQPQACAVRARLGSREKTLLVFGERFWNGSQPSAPQPFESIPLDRAHAYGGPDFTLNPQGRGRVPVDGVHWMPNIELPHDRLLRQGQAITPAGFGPLDLMHPQRTALRGTYDADYLKLHAPGFAPDTDWRYFNLAPSDQWLDQALVGDEPFSFENMHPERPLIQGRLPGMRVRVFVGYRMDNAEPKVREVPLRLTTVWFFPHALRAIAIFQGLAEVDTDDGSDVLSLLGAVERLGEVRSDSHYLEAAAKRADPKTGALYALIDSDLLPSGVDTTDPDVEAAKAPFAIEGLQAEAQYRRAQTDVALARERVRGMGQDPDALGIRMPPRETVPTGDALPPYLEAKLKEAEAAQWAAVETAVGVLERALATKVDLSTLAHRGPPTYDPERHWNEIKAMAAQAKPPLDLKALYRKLCQLEDVHRANYLQCAHMQPPAWPMPPAEAAKWRDEIGRAVAAGIRFFAGINLTGADLSGLDLRQANFEGAWLESVNFSNSNLSGANFKSAVLAHARFDGAIAVSAQFQKANLGKALLARAVFDGSDFTGAMLMHCDLAATQMRRAVLVQAQLLETTWGAADWQGAVLSGQTFYKLDLQGMRLSEADLSSANFIECDLTAVDLQGARLDNATFATCRLDRANLRQAQAVGAVAVKDSSLSGADLSGADLRRFNFGASNLRGAQLVRAQLDGANLSEARLDGADLRLASAKGALMRMCVCRQAQLAGANLSEAILQKADLRGADLRRTNLFGADLSRVQLDAATRFEDALVHRARTWPRLTPEQNAQQAAP